MLEAHQLALDDVTDHQLKHATRWLVKYHAGDWVPSSAEVRSRAMKYPATPQAEAARIAHNRRCLALALEDRS